MVQARGCSVSACFETGLSWGVPRGSASAQNHGSLLTQVQELAAMAVDGAVTVLQLCRSIIVICRCEAVESQPPRQ